MSERLRERFVQHACSVLLQRPAPYVGLRVRPSFRQNIPPSEENFLLGLGDSILHPEGNPAQKQSAIRQLQDEGHITQGENMGIPGASSEEILLFSSSQQVASRLREVNYPNVLVTVNGNDWRQFCTNDSSLDRLRSVGSHPFGLETFWAAREGRKIGQTLASNYEGILEAIWQHNPYVRFLLTTPPDFTQAATMQFEPFEGTQASSQLLDMQDPTNNLLAGIITSATKRGIIMGIYRFMKRHFDTLVAIVPLTHITNFDPTGHFDLAGHRKFADTLKQRTPRHYL